MCERKLISILSYFFIDPVSCRFKTERALRSHMLEEEDGKNGVDAGAQSKFSDGVDGEEDEEEEEEDDYQHIIDLVDFDVTDKPFSALRDYRRKKDEKVRNCYYFIDRFYILGTLLRRLRLLVTITFSKATIVLSPV